MARKLTATPNQTTAIQNARFELAELRSVLEVARRAIAQMDAQDSTRYFDRVTELKTAIKSYDAKNMRTAYLAEIDAFLYPKVA